MKIIVHSIVLFVVAAGGAGAGYWFARHASDAKASEPNAEVASTTMPAEEEKPVATVVTTPLTTQPITETTTAYGSVLAQAAEVRVISVPFESRVARVLVTPGQHVAAGTTLVLVEPSPDAAQSVQEAKNAVGASETDLKETERRFTDRLATNADLLQTKQALQSARLKLNNLIQRGVDRPHELKAEDAGIVLKINGQQGQITPAGGSLIELAPGDHFEVKLGVEPEDVSFLEAGHTVHMKVVGAPEGKAVDGKIRAIARRVDPATRLVDVFVSLPDEAQLLLESFVVAEIERSSAEGYVVPRDAALPDDEGHYTVFTAAEGHAHQHAVRTGLQTDHDVQIFSDDLHVGDAIVVVGNAQLQDGMEVLMKDETGASPATRPATATAATTVPEAQP